jgi:outer membrane protein
MSALLVATFSTAYADNKIGVVDFQKLTQSSGKLDNIRNELEKKFKSRRDELVKMEEKLKKDFEAFKRDSAVMSDAKKKEAQQKLIEAQQKFDKEGQAYQQDLSNAHNQAMQKLGKEVQQAVSKVAEADKFDLIVQKESVPYSNSKLDVTDKVLKALK